MRNVPSFVDTIGALIKGYLPRVFHARGWVLAGLILVPYIVVLLATNISPTTTPARTALELYHNGYAQIVLPILALVAAPGCIREDLEQRTLPLMLVRPAPAWALPLGKATLWFVWCSIWLAIVVTLMPSVGLDIASVPRKILALVLTFWAQLGFVSLLLMLFKRGTLWAALFFFIWDPLVRVFPPAMQRMTFTHYMESLAVSSYSKGDVIGILAQTQITSPLWLGTIVLLAVGMLTWGISGLKLMRLPVGLAGREAEG